MNCGDIKGGASYDCQDPLQGGAIPKIWRFNKADIDGVTTGATIGGITGFTLKSGKSAYLFEGFGRSVSPTQEVIELGSGQNLTKHQTVSFIFDRSQAMKNIIQDILLGTFVDVIEGTKHSKDSFEVYGLNNGLQLQPGKINDQNADNGAYTITLATPKNQGESKLPPTFYDEVSYTTTRDILNGYLFQPTITNLSVLAVSVSGSTALTITGTNYFGGGSVTDVVSVKWVNQSTLAETNQTGLTITNTTIAFSSVAIIAGNYKLKVTTSKGVAYSLAVVVAS